MGRQRDVETGAPVGGRAGGGRVRRRLGALCALAVASCGGEGDPALPAPKGAVLAVSPVIVKCGVGELVRIAVVGAAPGVPYGFAAPGAGDVVRVAVDGAERGAASLRCAAVGTAVVTVSDGRHVVSVPVAVSRTPGAVLGVEVEPRSITLVTGAMWRLVGRALPRDTGVSAALRFASLDSGVAVADETGLVRARGAGTTIVLAAAAADPSL